MLNLVLVSTSVPVDRKVRLLEIEWDDIVTKWLPLHVSDHSAVHYASQVLQFWILELKASSTSGGNSLALGQVASRVMSQVRCLIDSLESHETLWILRRLVVRILWESRQASCGSVVLEDVKEVTTSIEQWRNKNGPTATPNIHSLTFLAWVAGFLPTRNQDPQSHIDSLSLFPLDLFSMLQDHPWVYHRMWQAVGPRDDD